MICHEVYQLDMLDINFNESSHFSGIYHYEYEIIISASDAGRLIIECV